MGQIFVTSFTYVPLTKILIVFQEVKLLKHEIDLLPKDRRKEEFKHRKENLERDQKRRVRQAEENTTPNVAKISPL